MCGGEVSQLCACLARFVQPSAGASAGRGTQRLLLQGLYAKMVEAFKKMGLEVVPGVGTPFDPEVRRERPTQGFTARPMCTPSQTERS